MPAAFVISGPPSGRPGDVQLDSAVDGGAQFRHQLEQIDPVAALLGECLTDTGEDEVVLSAHHRYVARMRHAATIEARQRESAGSRPPSVLGFEAPGSLRNLQWQILPERELAPDEVEIEPIAVGLNFRDVMYAMGLLSDEAVENGFAGPTIGMELSGHIRRLGRDVQGYRIGDAVVGFAPACYATRVRTPASAVCHKPASLGFEAAATIPSTFFTAYYALHELGRLRPGEKVLIDLSFKERQRIESLLRREIEELFHGRNLM